MIFDRFILVRTFTFYAIIISTCRSVNWWKLNTFHLFSFLFMSYTNVKYTPSSYTFLYAYTWYERNVSYVHESECVCVCVYDWFWGLFTVPHFLHSTEHLNIECIHKLSVLFYIKVFDIIWIIKPFKRCLLVKTKWIVATYF